MRAAVERSEVQFGRTLIPYEVRRTRREKTVAIAVDPVAGVQLKAPPGATLEDLDRIVRRKAKWILERRKRQSDLPPSPTERQFVSGETFLYAGRQYRLKLRYSARDEEGVSLSGGRLHITLDAAYRGVLHEKHARELLVAWYRQHAQPRLEERVAAWAPIVGVEPGAVLLREQKRRWASCDTHGNLRFNWRIVQAPRSLLDYIIVHELVHLIERDHTREYWRLLGRAVPDYERRREELRKIGRQLVW